MPAGAMSGPKRKHVTTACVSCRESKVKCDARTPTCSNCESKSKECCYRVGDDRRKFSVRLAISILSERIEQLCEFITDNSLQPPPMNNEQKTTLDKVLENLRLSHGNSKKDNAEKTQLAVDPHTATLKNGSIQEDNFGGFDSQFDMDGLVVTTSQPQQWIWNGYSDSNPNGYVPNLSGTNPLEDSPLSNLAEGITSNDVATSPYEIEDWSIADHSSEALVEQLSDRMGSLKIGPGGKVHYYGPTSDFYLVDMPPPDNLTIHRTVRNDGKEHLKRLAMDREANEELKIHLTNLYFAWQDPAIHVVDRKMYEEAEKRWYELKEDTPYFSEALQNAIYALGAAFEARNHPTFVTFPKSLSDYFADRAKALLEIELDSPSIATVQAMVVLSGHDVGCKRDARGWLYSGMAIRLSFDLALHVDMSSYVQKETMSQAEAEVRQVVFWGAFAADHMWGFHLGRPARINIQGVTVAKPGVSTRSDNWLPYTSPKTFDEIRPLSDNLDGLSRQRALLWEIMSPVELGFYSSTTMAGTTVREINANAISQLWNWKSNLPPLLQVNLDNQHMQYLPHVLLLHMQFHQHIIHTHRPLMSRASKQSNDTRDEGHNHARMVCVRSAMAIANLLKIYETQYTLQRVNVQAVAYAGSAALLLIFALVTNFQGQGKSDEVGLHLSTCLRALEQFGSSWENAKRVRDFLTILQRQWEVQARSDRQRQSSTAEEGSSPRKRARTSASLQEPLLSWLQPHQDPIMRVPNNISNNTAIDIDWVFTGDTFSDTFR